MVSNEDLEWLRRVLIILSIALYDCFLQLTCDGVRILLPCCCARWRDILSQPNAGALQELRSYSCCHSHRSMMLQFCLRPAIYYFDCALIGCLWLECFPFFMGHTKCSFQGMLFSFQGAPAHCCKVNFIQCLGLTALNMQRSVTFLMLLILYWVWLVTKYYDMKVLAWNVQGIKK